MLLAVDIETTGLNPRTDQITVIGVFDGVSYRHYNSVNDFAAYIAALPERPNLVCHNASFDINFILWHLNDPTFRTRIKTVHDTQVMAHVHGNKPDEGFLIRYEAKRQRLNQDMPVGKKYRATSPTSLKVLAPYFLKVPSFWEKPGNYSDLEYNKKDCVYTFDLYMYFKTNMSRDEIEFYETRMLPWLEMLMQMERTGVAYNNQEHATVEKEYIAKEVRLKEELDAMWASHHAAYRELQESEVNAKYDEMTTKALEKAKDKDKCKARYAGLRAGALAKVEQKINYASPLQLKWLFKDRLGLDITKLDDEDEESTGKAVLNQLVAQGRKDIAKFLEWREAQKVLTMYLPTYKELQHNETIFPRFNLTGTRTGRLSSSSPNFQQLPPKLYRLFKPRPGHVFIKYDYGAIEAVLIAMFSDDAAMTTIVTKGLSIHDYTTKMVFELPEPVEQIKDKHPDKRKAIKTITFACLYGAGANRIKVAFQQAGINTSEDEAREIREKLRQTYPEAFAFHRDITGAFETGGEVLNLLGRPLKIQNPEDAYMKGFNTLIQSSASDLALTAAHKTLSRWKDAEIAGKHLALIHDAILSEVPIDRAAEADKIMRECMLGFKLKNKFGSVPLSIEGGVTGVWE